MGLLRIDQCPHWDLRFETSFPTQREAPAKEPEATAALRELCRRLRAARPTAMSALSSDVAGDVDMSIDEHDDSAMNVDDARFADQEGATEVEQPTAKRAKVGEQGKEQDDGMGDEAGKVREFLTDVPMENKYRGKNYYVRECYSTYYDLVMRLFNEEEMDGVTVTGTPGIGKSIFMAYFFQRFRKEFFKKYEGSTEAMILLASYDKTSVLKKVVIVKDEETDPEIVQYELAAMQAARRKYTAAARGKTIWLLDGPPDTIPDDVRWVSFTSPNETWMKKLSKNTATTAKIYMPVWELDELCDAASKLGRDELLETIDDDLLRDFRVNPNEIDKHGPRPTVLEYRFKVFGGVPRVCLENRRPALRAAFSSMLGAVEAMKMDAIVAAMRKKEVPVQVHRLLHYVPGECREDATVHVASSELEKFLMKRQEAMSDADRSNFEKIARHIPEMSTMLGYAVEARAYRMLESGCTIKARKLTEETRELTVGAREHAEGPKTWVIPPQASAVRRIPNSFEITPFDRTVAQLMIPESKNLPSIDALYWVSGVGNCVLLFQVTVSTKHPVKAFGCVKVLQSLGHWGAVQESPETAAALVFVVPTWKEHEFQKPQPIASNPRLDETSDVDKISGVGAARAGKLKKLQTPIRTVGDLRTSGSEVQEVVQAKSFLKQHEEKAGAFATGSPEVQLVQRIPQYVWGI